MGQPRATQPNTALRAVRTKLLMSQDEMARAVRDAGIRAGEPNGCTKRLVQRWEAGEVTSPQPAYARALESVTGQPIETLGFKADERYGLNRDEAMGVGGGPWVPPLPDPKAKPEPLTGIWRSTYHYISSGRGNTEITGQHYVVIIQHGAKLQVRSLPESAASRLAMDLTANGQVVTGTWTEQTNPAGYYQGAVYHGAIQMLSEPTGRKLTGKWVGFGRDFDVNTGDWRLELVSSAVDNAAMDRFNKRPDAHGAAPADDARPAGNRPA